MRCGLPLILLSGLFSASLHAEDKPAPPPPDAEQPSSGSPVIDLYVDIKTKQIYAEPGEGGVRMGSFERVADKPVKPAAAENAGQAVAVGKGKEEGGVLLRDVPKPVEKRRKAPKGLVTQAGKKRTRLNST
jgi:hypothetical protein